MTSTVPLLLAALPAIVLACAPDYSVWQDGWCYRLYANQGYLSNYNATCRSDGGHLPSIHSDQENANLVSSATRKLNAFQTPFYLGLVCNGDAFAWDDGTPFDYDNFEANDTRCSTDNGGYFVQADGTWAEATPGYSSTYGVCQSTERSVSPCDDFEAISSDKEGISACYKLIPTATAWQSAENACEQRSAHLPSIHDQTTNDFIRRTAVGSGLVNGMHIGLQQVSSQNASTYAWTDGTAVDYTNYAPGFPLSQYGTCMAMQTGMVSGEWMNVQNYGTALPYVCTKPPFEVTDTQPAECPTNTFTDGDTIYSPSYPAPSGLAECDYVIIAPETSNRIRLTVDFFETNYCCDSLTVIDGLFGYTVINTLSGSVSSGQTIMSQTNGLRLFYNATSGANTRGFKIDVNVI